MALGCLHQRAASGTLRQEPLVYLWNALSSSFLVSEHTCILNQSGQNFTACFWQHVKEFVFKPLASDWSAQFSENFYSVQSFFCAKYKLTADDYIALTATTLQVSCSRWNFKYLEMRQVFHSSGYEYHKFGPLPPR